MFGNVKLIGEERSYPSKLHDALPSVHDCNLILAHKLYATLSSDEFDFYKKILILPILLHIIGSKESKENQAA